MIVKKDPDLIISYLQDYSNLKGGLCEAVFLPDCENEIINIFHECRKSAIPLAISGGGTAVTGGRIPFGGYLLSTEKLTRISGPVVLSQKEATIDTGAGVLLKDFLDTVKKSGYFYPPDPTEKSSFLGGNVATSASGARSFRFGSTRDYVCALKMVLPSGEVLSVQRGELTVKRADKIRLRLDRGGFLEFEIPRYEVPSAKNAAGYYVKDGMDIIDILIGSEGTLGVITDISLKVIKAPSGILDCYAFFKKEAAALLFVDMVRSLSIKNRSNPAPAIDAMSIEFFDKNALDLLRQKHSRIPSGVEAAIYFEQLASHDAEDSIIEKWSGLLEDCGASTEDTWFASKDNERQVLADIRHDLPDMVNEYLRKNRQRKIGTDIAVPFARLKDMLEYYKKALGGSGLRYIIFGHIGDAHLHVNILPKDTAEFNKAQDIYEAIVKKAVSLGGTISAEHGIGKVKHKYLEIMYGKDSIRQMAVLKKSFDPYCILGLDNIFPKAILETI